MPINLVSASICVHSWSNCFIVEGVKGLWSHGDIRCGRVERSAEEYLPLVIAVLSRGIHHSRGRDHWSVFGFIMI